MPLGAEFIFFIMIQSDKVNARAHAKQGGVLMLYK